MILSPGHIEMDPTKLNRIRNWPTLTKVKDMCSFLGFENFYRKFISDYSNIVCPLLDLTKKDTLWNWNNSCQNAFNRLKNCFLTKPVLPIPMENGTHAPTYLNCLDQQNETMTFMIENSLPSFEASRLGTITCKDHHPQYKSSPTTKTPHSWNKPRSSTEGKADGCWTLLTMILNLYTYQEVSFVPPMPYPDDTTSFKTLTMTMMESLSYPPLYLLTS